VYFFHDGTVQTCGWVEQNISNETTPGIYSFLCNVPNTGEKNFFEVTMGLWKGHDLLARYLRNVEKKIFRTQAWHTVHQKTQNFA
jgi:hypothetical protein